MLRRRWPYAVVLVVLLVVDLWAKDAAFRALNGYEDVPAAWKTIDVIPGLFRLVVVRNTGATFGLGQGYGAILSVLNMAAIVLLTVALLRTRPDRRFQAVSLALILAGAVGNLYDRLRFGYVRDFLDFYVGTAHWPPFNVADSCIVVGVIVLAAVLWRAPAEKKKE